MKYTFTLFSFLLSLFVCSISTVKAQSVSKTDSLALVGLYNETGGDLWTNHDNWLTSSPVCTWYGITVSCNRVTGIMLGVNNLTGKLPSCLGNLSNLQYLHLYNNQLTGSLPSSLSKLVSLKELLLGTNLFSGDIPASIGKLVALQQLDLANNKFEKSIPFAIGNLVNAEYINLNNNELTGRIPTTIGKLVSVRILEMAGNKLHGSIPAEIGKLQAVLFLHLQNNKLSGVLPSAIGMMQSLQVFYADNNRLSGSLTSAIGNAKSLQLLSLHHNQLTGIIPSSLANLPNLVYLYLNSNDLHGSIPSSFLAFTSLQYLYLDHNHLTLGTNKTPALPLNVALQADISHNNFTFDGMEFVATHYPFITYAPQAILLAHKNGESITLYAGGTLSNNTYAWYKIEDKSHTFIYGDSSFRPAAGGHYYAAVRNTVATHLLLYTDTFEYTKPASAEKTIASVRSVHNDSAFLIYPNPARDIVHIRTEGRAIIILTDINGKQMLSKTVNGNDVIDVSRFAAGTYSLQNKTTGDTKALVVVR